MIRTANRAPEQELARGIFKQVEKVAIALRVKLNHRHKAQRRRVDAVSLAGGLRAIIKDVAEVDLGANPACTEQLSFTGGAVGTTAVEIDLTTAGTGTAGSTSFAFAADAATFTASSAASAGTNSFTYAGDVGQFGAATSATAGSVSTSTFGSTLTFDNAGDQLNFTIAVDGGTARSITIDATTLSNASLGTTIDDDADLAAAITQAINDDGFYTVGTDLSVSASGGAVSIQSASTGTSSSIAISSVAAVNGGGADTLTNTSGLANATNSGAAAVAADAISFDIAVDGAASPTTVTIDHSTLAGVGDFDNQIDSIGELQSAIEAGLTAAGVSGVTVSNDGTDITFTSSTTGSSSAVAISNLDTNADGGGNTNSVYGLTAGGGTAGSDAVTGDSLTFDVAVDGGGTTSVTIDRSTLATVGNQDGVVDGIGELQSAIQAGLTAANVSGVTVSNDGTNITLTSATQGSSSAVAISNVAANGAGTSSATFGLGSTTATAGTGSAAAVAKTVDALVAEINSNTTLDGKIRATNDNGKLRIENQSTQDLDIGGINSSGKIDGGGTSGKIEGNDVRGDLATQFNELKDQLDKLSDDASFNGINLLRGDNLQITFNETGTSTLEIQTKGGEAINASALKLETIEASKLDADTDIDALIGQVGDALNSIRSQSSAFGSNLSMVENRQDFTQSMINTLQTGADNLVLADTNEEAANMLALQTRQQLSSTALSLASQQDQAVLRLF